MEQFGLAIKDGASKELILSPFISGIIRGISSSYLNLDDKSITKAPALTKSFAYSSATFDPAEKIAKFTLEQSKLAMSSIRYVLLLKTISSPTEDDPKG